jgi:hypothetical protein
VREWLSPSGVMVRGSSWRLRCRWEGPSEIGLRATLSVFVHHEC